MGEGIIMRQETIAQTQEKEKKSHQSFDERFPSFKTFFLQERYDVNIVQHH